MNHEWIEVPLRITDKIGDFFLWAGVRLLIITPAFMIYGWVQLSKLSLHMAQLTQASYAKLLIVFDSLPYGGMAGSKLIEVEAKTIESAIAPLTDLLAAIEEKELQIIGEKGTGKSTLAQYLAYSFGGHVRVYEPEGTPEDWNGLEVVGKGEDWDAIDTGLAQDLEHISNQMKLRRERGDAALAGTDKVIIGEEFPEIVSKCSNSEEWLDRHARRGRKAKIRLILLSQYDRVSAWGMEGKSDLLDCFFRLRLGKKAILHAQKLKRTDLVDWLRSSRSHALLDDEPIILPDYREMKRVIDSFSRTFYQLPPTVQFTSNSLPNHFQDASNGFLKIPPGSTAESDFQPLEALQKENFSAPKSPENGDFSGVEGDFEATWQAHFWETWQAIQAEKSNYWIGKNIFGIVGGSSYQQLSQRLDEVRGIKE